MTPRLRLLVITATGATGRTLSYQHGWPRALAADPRLEVEVVDIAGRRSLGDRLRLPLRGHDAIVLLHSTFSNERLVTSELAARLRRARAPKVWFIGNEYKLMPEKMAFAEEIGTALLVSQLEVPDVLRLYRDRLGCAVVGIPNTGLDGSLFAGGLPAAERDIDLGYRAFESPWYLGHRERPALAQALAAAAARAGLRADISLDEADRLGEAAWAAFLGRCRGQLGSEAGGDYFELDDRTRHAVNAYLAEQPEATFDEVHERFFRAYEAPVSGRCISSRIVEAAGTGTAQLLIEGWYSGYLRPGVHYIPLRRDLSNADEAVAAFCDPAARARVAEAAAEVAREQFAFPRLVGRLLAAIDEAVGR